MIDAMQAGFEDRLIGAAGTVVMIGLLGYALLFGLAVDMRARGDQPMILLDLHMKPPSPPHPKAHAERATRHKASGRASPRNLRNKPAEIVAPPTPVILPAPIPVVSAPKAGPGMAAAAGASDRPGPGTGAGGQGDGTGSGGYGNGEGGSDVPPRQIKGRLRFGDLPADLRERRIGGTVSVHYSVEVDGSVGNCAIIGSSGNTELDRLTCELIRQRFRFRPSRDRDGRPVRSTIEEEHSWTYDRPDEPRS
jgi:protein TonB